MSGLLLYFPLVLWGLGLLEFLSSILLGGPMLHPMGWSVWASALLLLAALVARRRALTAGFRAAGKELRAAPLPFRALIAAAIGIFALSAMEARLPPHLSQEYDAINYHMGLPLQHLMRGTLSHIDWSVPDLWPMALQWGLVPAWFLGAAPNKIPQLLFSLWGFIHLARLGRRLSPGSFRGWLPALAVFTTQGTVIQLGTGMLDLPALFLLLGAFSAVLDGRVFWAALSIALFSSIKSFSPMQSAVVLATAGLSIALLSDRGALLEWTKKLKVPIIGGCALSALLLARTFWVDLSRAGTPLFPFATCAISSSRGCQSSAGEIIRESTLLHLQTWRNYGIGRGIIPWIEHVWQVAVADRGVNNAYDYPLGLAWLLLCVFVAFDLPRIARKRRLSPYLAFAAAFWVTWWFGSQQSRWLYPTLALGWLGTVEVQKRARPALLCLALAVGAAVSLVSHWRALKDTLFLSPATLQAEQRRLLKRDERTKLPTSIETLYWDEPILDHAPMGRTWILR